MIHDILAVLIALVAMLLSIYSIFNLRNMASEQSEIASNQRKMESQLDRKEKLRSLADDLEELISLLERFTDALSNPKQSRDLWLQLDLLGKNILANKHDTGKSTIVFVARLDAGVSDESREVENLHQGLSALKGGEMVTVALGTKGNENADASMTTFDIGNPFLTAKWIYELKSEWDEDDRELIQQFQPKLIENLGPKIDRINKQIFRQLFDNADGIDFHPDDYENVEELCQEIYREFTSYDGVAEDLGSLRELIADTKETRTAVTQTSYS